MTSKPEGRYRRCLYQISAPTPTAFKGRPVFLALQNHPPWSGRELLHPELSLEPMLVCCSRSLRPRRPGTWTIGNVFEVQRATA